MTRYSGLLFWATLYIGTYHNMCFQMSFSFCVLVSVTTPAVTVMLVLHYHLYSDYYLCMLTLCRKKLYVAYHPDACHYFSCNFVGVNMFCSSSSYWTIDTDQQHGYMITRLCDLLRFTGIASYSFNICLK